MKLISFVVPSYNAQDYMSKCIESLLLGGEEVEILIVDDGSKDNTGKIADEYQSKYPTIVKAIHQENGGHGAGLASGLKAATGLYFKCVDSDDWLLKESLLKTLDRIRDDVKNAAGDEEKLSDLYVTDYTYYHGENSLSTISFAKFFPTGKIVEWKDTKKLGLVDYLTIHASMFRTEILRKSNLNIPIHTFYEDDYFAYAPLANTKRVCYLGYTLYCYFVGRPGQSVQRDIAISRYQDYMRVGLACFKQYNPVDYKDNKILYKNMMHELWLFVALGSVHGKLFRKKDFKDNPKKNMLDSKVDLKKYKADLKAANPKLYRKLVYGTSLWLTFLPNPLGYLICLFSYNVSQKAVKFN